MDNLLDVQGDKLLKIAVYDFKGAKENSYPRLKHLEHGFQVAVSGEKWMDISRKGADKGAALELIQRRLSLSARAESVLQRNNMARKWASSGRNRAEAGWASIRV